MKEGVV